MAFTGFGKGAIAFYDELAGNNSREWWLANKRRYEDEVRRPMEELLEDVADEFGEAKLFRPNRDTRFSKDKSPYKTNIAAVIFGDGGGSVYLSLSAEGLHVGGGGYHLDRDAAGPLPGGRSTTIGPARSSRRSPPTLRRAKADVTSHTLAQDRPARLLGRPPAHRRCCARTASSASGPTDPAPGSSKPAAKDRVVDGWRALRPLNDWMAEHVGTSATSR